jgi:hypothetical protein
MVYARPKTFSKMKFAIGNQPLFSAFVVLRNSFTIGRDAYCGQRTDLVTLGKLSNTVNKCLVSATYFLTKENLSPHMRREYP